MSGIWRKTWNVLNKDVKELTLDDFAEIGKDAFRKAWPYVTVGSMLLSPSLGLAKSAESAKKVKMLDDYELQFFGGAVDVEAEPQNSQYDGVAWLRHSEKVEGLPANGMSKSGQDDAKLQYQFADLLNALGLFKYDDAKLLPVVTQFLQDYARFNGRSDFSNVRIVRGPQNMILDVLIDGGSTCVRRDHACYSPKSGAPLNAVLPLVDENYIKSVGTGNVVVKISTLSGACPDGHSLNKIDEQGNWVCIPTKQGPQGPQGPAGPTGKPGDNCKSGSECTSGKCGSNGKCTAPEGDGENGSRTGSLDAYLQTFYGSNSWDSTVETPDANGVPIEKTQKTDNTLAGARLLFVYNLTDQIGLAGGADVISFGGTESGSRNDWKAGVAVGNNQYGILGLFYVDGEQTLSREDKPMTIKRTWDFSGVEAEYASPDLLKSDNSLYFLINASQLSGSSDTTVDFGTPLIPEKKKSSDSKETNVGGRVSAHFLPVGKARVGLTGEYSSSQMKLDDGDWQTNTWGIGPSVLVPFRVGGRNATLDVGVEYVSGEQKPGDDSVKDTKMSGYMLRLQIRPDGPSLE